jgi:hypothetical protein
VQVDIQLSDIAKSTTELRSVIIDVRRSDGALKNGIAADSLLPSLTIGFQRARLVGCPSYAAGDGPTLARLSPSLCG